VELRGKVAVVTGSGGAGCGRAIARRLGHEGASVVVSDLNADGMHETAALIRNVGGTASVFRADVREESQVRALIAHAVANHGGLHVLVNNASGPGYYPDQPLEFWRAIVETDLLGAMTATRVAIDAMRQSGGGAIVNMTSISALPHGGDDASDAPAYDVAKMGLIRLTTNLATLAVQNIRVNCLAPGWIASPGPLEYWQSLTPQKRRELGVPSRLLQPEEIADAVVRLTTDDSLYGRVMVWHSEKRPFLIAAGDRGYESATEV
jgi:NAD(P)-dependent dehydrogenase (short-subunit alcohol dehydrogenase family)